MEENGRMDIRMEEYEIKEKKERGSRKKEEYGREEEMERRVGK